MTPPPHSPSRLESLYASAILLYPRAFREAYGAAMRQIFRDALQDPTLSRRALIPLVLRDLLSSLAQEHLVMLRETFARPALIFNAFVLAGFATILALALYAIPQQVLRQGANDPQIQLADDLVARLEQGVAPSQAVPAGSVDMARSLSPFVIAYDDQGRPLASQAQLDGAIPVPPSGVFDFVRQHGEERVSWQPRLGAVSTRDAKSTFDGRIAPQPGSGIRIAAVVQRVSGAHPGFVLAGRSLREVEEREALTFHMAALSWIAMLGLILVGTAAFGWYTRPKTA